MTIREYSVEATHQYLRTVLLVDDQLFTKGNGIAASLGETNLPDIVSMPDTTNPAAVVGQGPTESTVSSDSSITDTIAPKDSSGNRRTDSLPFCPQTVVEGFAKHGMVCGLYQPTTVDFEADPGLSSLIALCDRADVFILDWKLKCGEPKSPVPELLDQLLSKSKGIGDPKPIRFCAVYTSLSEDTAFEELIQALEASHPTLKINTNLEQLKVSLQGLTIRIYGKSKDQINHVPSSGLASRIIQDFSFEYEGIMSAAALRGIAAIRENAKRILERFPPSLDYDLMVHGGLTVKDPTVSDDIQDLISDEIHSVLSSSALPDDDIYSMLREKAESINESVIDHVFTKGDLQEGKKAADVKHYFESVFHERTIRRSFPFKDCCSDSQPRRCSFEFLRKLQNLVLELAGRDFYSEGALARLFCQRTVYDAKRILKSGTVVCRVSDKTFYLCLMPPCDCIRLKNELTSFPFWKLSPVEKNHDGRSHGIAILDSNGQSLELCLKGKIRKQMKFWDFLPDGVVAFCPEGERFLLSTADGQDHFEWIAELKPLHAQRMAEYISRQFSRVGLSESEWLRLQVDR